MNNKEKVSISLVLSFFLISCSSTPPLITPTRSLVVSNEMKLGKEVSLVLAKRLDRAPVGEVVHFEHFALQLGEKYTSALGFICRNVFIAKGGNESSDRIKRVACNENALKAEWVLIPSIEDQTINNDYLILKNIR
ncbi:hypothetical protein [Aliikangiella sp. G2MR2-5]|uniref:hypothetical protein n=1 Tax=Aliikangiella sp. G2MR2-5 TaxID=2788943 RepID=UPI0018AADE37|nr:hypothetical protein [Aliikangiella sp. G2MR2-5]